MSNFLDLNTEVLEGSGTSGISSGFTNFGTGEEESYLPVVSQDEEEDIRAAQEHSTILGGILSGLDNNFSFNLAREGRALLGSETLMNNDWFFGKFHYGDKPWTEEEEKGFGWTSVQEQMGVSPEEWDAMPHNERVKQLNDVSQKQIQDKYNPDVDTAAYQASRLFGYIADPTTLLAIRTPAQFAAVGAADMSLWEHGTTGELSPETPVIGAVGGYVMGKGIQMGKKFFTNRKSRKSNKVVNAFNDEMNIIAAGSNGKLSSPHIFALAKKNLGISDEVIDNAFAELKIKPHIPTKGSAIKNIIKESTEEVVMPGSTTGLGKSIDYLIEPVSEGIKRLSPRIFGKLKQISRAHFEDTHRYAMMVDPFLRATFKSKTFSTAEKNKLQLMMINAKSNEDKSGIIKYLYNKGKEISKEKGNALVKDWKLYRQAMDDIHAQRVDVGNDKLDKIIGYSPRKIIDFEAWYKGTRKEERSVINRMIVKEYKIKPEEATKEMLQKVISRYLSGKGAKKNIQIAGSAKARTRETVSEAQLPAYQDQWNTTHKYIKEAMEEVQRYKLFGTKNIAVDGNMTDTISNYVAQEKYAGRLKGEAIDDIQPLLAARFIDGPKQMKKGLAVTKDVGYMTLLGHPTNAIRQLGDLAFSAYENGAVNTTRGLWSTLNKGRYMSPKEMGLLDNIAEEFASDTIAKRGTDFAFKYSGFRAVDAMGKGTLANSTIHKFARDTMSAKGRTGFMKKFGAYLGPEDASRALDEFKAFKTGKINKPTQLMKDVAFIKLARIQPVDLLEMPKGYLQNPNGRMLYMLKSFAIKHMNVIRQDIGKEIRKGNRAKGLNKVKHYNKAMKNTALLGSYFVGINIGADKLIDYAYGRDTKIEDTIITNVYRSTGFLSKYDVDQMGRDGDVYSWSVGLPVPPLDPMAEGIIQAGHVAYNLGRGKKWDANIKHAGGDIYPNIPILGRLMKAWLVKE